MTAPTTMTPLNLPLDGTGTTLIEASAGTGKTYALTTLAARLIVEAGHEISDLLVVTFTVAATDELRDRLRRTLRAIQSAAAGERGGSEQAHGLMARWAALDIPAAEVGRRLEPAMLDLDRANVLTIHGFCQRVINDFAFDCGLPFGFEVSGDGFDVMSAEVRDHWRRCMVPAPRMRVQFAREERFLPKVPGLDLFGRSQNLTDWVANHLGKPGFEIRGAAPLDDAAMQTLAAQEAGWETALEAARLSATAAEGTAGLQPVLAALERPLAVVFDPKETFTKIAAAMPQPGGLGRDLAALDHATETLLGAYQEWLPQARRAALEETREGVARRIREDRLLGYDDLLLTVHEALSRTPGLGARIRRRYPFALIDEYQDTDRVQADIFQSIYGAAGSMVIVGDPKQSIYRFRSADVFAYLRASAAVGDDARLTLGKNYRSVPPLVSAVNTVFGCAHPFGLPNISFTAATPALSQDGSRLRLVGEEDAPPLQFRLIPGQGKKRLRKNETAPLAAAQAADEIARLLALSSEGGASVGGQPLRGSDIAVLVRKTEQGRQMRAALARRGVRSVEIGVDDVFDSREAEQLERLLWAVASPNSLGRMRGALAGDLFGLDAAELARLADDEDAWKVWKERLGEWRATWQAGGVAGMVRRLLRSFDAGPWPEGQAPDGGARQLLRHTDGARRLTNVMHLADLLQAAEAAGRLTPTALAAWLSRRRARVNPHDEVAQLRLESDEQLVKIVTVHRSKGLEFPIVFVPFAWDAAGGGGPTPWAVQFHDRDSPGLPEVLHLAPTDKERGKERLEDFSEEVRLFYVALTRARLRCVVTWARANYSEFAPLSWLLREPGLGADTSQDPVAALARTRAAAKAMDADAWLACVKGLVKRCPNGIAATEVRLGAQAPRVDDDPAAPPLTARRLDRALRRVRQMTSYSALAGRGGAALSDQDHETLERPDHDLDAALEDAGESLLGGIAVERSPFTFPTGARVGSCLHEMFERRARGTSLKAVVDEGLTRHHIDPAWREVAMRMVENTWAAPLMAAAGPGRGHTWRIADLAQPLPELEFHLPARRLRRGALGNALEAHGYSPPFAQAQEETLDGYLRGFIDLVAEWQGCWFVSDYKTNLLGRGGVEYSPPRLAAAVERHGYQLQYLLYLLALHRHLRLRLPDYDYERHIGGAFYLFARGIDPALAGDPSRGIYFDRPSAACIKALDTCFAGCDAR